MQRARSISSYPVADISDSDSSDGTNESSTDASWPSLKAMLAAGKGSVPLLRIVLRFLADGRPLHSLCVLSQAAGKLLQSGSSAKEGAFRVLLILAGHQTVSTPGLIKGRGAESARKT